MIIEQLKLFLIPTCRNSSSSHRNDFFTPTVFNILHDSIQIQRIQNLLNLWSFLSTIRRFVKFQFLCKIFPYLLHPGVFAFLLLVTLRRRTSRTLRNIRRVACIHFSYLYFLQLKKINNQTGPHNLIIKTQYLPFSSSFSNVFDFSMTRRIFLLFFLKLTTVRTTLTFTARDTADVVTCLTRTNWYNLRIIFRELNEKVRQIIAFRLTCRMDVNLDWWCQAILCVTCERFYILATLHKSTATELSRDLSFLRFSI